MVCKTRRQPGRIAQGRPGLTENKPVWSSNLGMSFDNDALLVQQTARKMLDRDGARARRIAIDYAELAHELGDTFSAEAWRNIANAIERLQPR